MESGFDVLIPRLCSLGLGVIVCCCGEVGTVVAGGGSRTDRGRRCAHDAPGG